jgi:argininosuccinate lyase
MIESWVGATNTLLAQQGEEIAVAAVEALGLEPEVAHAELRLTPAGPALIAVNPRPAGNQINEPARRVAGIDLPMVHARERPGLTSAETGVRSAAIAFPLPEPAGRISAVHGTGELAADPGTGIGGHDGVLRLRGEPGVGVRAT